MPIIDSQVHAYEANTPKRPWHSVPNWPPHVTGDEMVAAMDKVGVDGAIFISASSLYQYDASYAVEVQRKHPGRFAIIKPVNPADPAVGEVIAEWKKQPGAVAVRIMMTAREGGLRPDDPGLDRIAREAARHGFPERSTCCSGGTSRRARRSSIAIRIPASSSTNPRSCSRARRPAAGALATCRSIDAREAARMRVSKVSGACTLSHQALSVPRPLESHNRRLIDAWGVERGLWGNPDRTRAFAVVNYEQAVEAFPQKPTASARASAPC